MNKRKVLLRLLLFCSVGLAACGHIGNQHLDYARCDTHPSPSGDAQPLHLTVEIKTAKTAINNYEIFSVSTTLRNIGSEALVLNQMSSCSYSEHWTLDSTFVHLMGEACEKDTPMEIRLKAGESYVRAVPVRAELAANKDHPESITFRLGFRDPAFPANPKNPPIWSNAVTVNVTQ